MPDGDCPYLKRRLVFALPGISLAGACHAKPERVEPTAMTADNAYAESLFRTMKYHAKYPSAGFATLEDASDWVRDFVTWYNHEHQHSGIGYVPPAARHTGEDIAILAARRTTYKIARSKHPERWARHTRAWSRPETVILNQKVDQAANNTASLAA